MIWYLTLALHAVVVLQVLQRPVWTAERVEQQQWAPKCVSCAPQEAVPVGIATATWGSQLTHVGALWCSCVLSAVQSSMLCTAIPGHTAVQQHSFCALHCKSCVLTLVLEYVMLLLVYAICTARVKDSTKHGLCSERHDVKTS